MSRVPLVVPLLVVTILSVAILVRPESRVLMVAVGVVLLASGLWFRQILRSHNRDHDTN
jgi:hypothetical protein